MCGPASQMSMTGRGQDRVVVLIALSSLFLITGEALPFLSMEGIPDYASKVVSEAADIIVQKVGWNKDSMKISSVDMKDAKLGETMAFEFNIEVGGEVLPVLLSNEILDWQFLEEVDSVNKEGTGKAIRFWQPDLARTAVKPFQLAGPVDLWIQDADKLRLAMPNDVDAGFLKRVLIADGAVVTVEGAREVSLTRPIALPLPLLRSSKSDGLASILVNLASRLRFALLSEGKPVSLRIVGPTTLIAAPSEESETTKVGLKVKRLSPSTIELVLKNEIVPMETPREALSAPWLWPLASLNGSNPTLVEIERALFAFLGPKAFEHGSITLLKAKAKMTSFVKISFQLESPLTNETGNLEDWPEWATKPSVVKNNFELLARVEEGQLQPVNVNQIQSEGYPTMTMSFGETTGNQTMGTHTPFLGTINQMSLNFDWNEFA